VQNVSITKVFLIFSSACLKDLGNLCRGYSKLVMSATAIVCRPSSSLLHLALFSSSNFPIAATKTLKVCRLPPSLGYPRYHFMNILPRRHHNLLAQPRSAWQVEPARRSDGHVQSNSIDWQPLCLAARAKTFTKKKKTSSQMKRVAKQRKTNGDRRKTLTYHTSKAGISKERQLRPKHKMAVIKTNQRT